MVESRAVTRCHCFSCNSEALGIECHNLELQCSSCGSDCVVRLEELAEESRRVAPPQPAAPAGAQVQQMWSLAQPTMINGAVRARIRGGRRDTASRRRQGPIAELLQGAMGGLLPSALSLEPSPPCNGCQAPSIAGTRYRCTHCRNVYLCSTCYERRAELHPDHEFETIQSPLRFDGSEPHLTDGAAHSQRHIFAIIEIGLEDTRHGSSGLSDDQVAWWLAQGPRLVGLEEIAEKDPGWRCPICSDGLEAESSNGWIVQICNGEGSVEGEPCVEDPNLAADTTSALAGHTYHEGCLRRWLLKRNSCPVCRRHPVVPPPS